MQSPTTTVTVATGILPLPPAVLTIIVATNSTITSLTTEL